MHAVFTSSKRVDPAICVSLIANTPEELTIKIIFLLSLLHVFKLVDSSFQFMKSWFLSKLDEVRAALLLVTPHSTWQKQVCSHLHR